MVYFGAIRDASGYPIVFFWSAESDICFRLRSRKLLHRVTLIQWEGWGVHHDEEEGHRDKISSH